MLVLTIIGLVIAGLAVYGFMEWFNGYTQKKASYTFFSAEHSMALIPSYLMILFGHGWWSNNYHTPHGDWLNGAIVMGLGIIILILTLVNNFKKTPRRIAMIGSIAQLILYIPFTIVAIIAIALAIAAASEIKPVYNLNSGD
ncbi:hypothetical protein [Sulfuricurvum sp.]|uniref:hypothetical protein n=1 Tax=Sulfuricurvum sp. TaxID=2025608 RepID=UPI003567A7AA